MLCTSVAGYLQFGKNVLLIFSVEDGDMFLKKLC